MDKCTFEYIKNLFVKSETKPTLKLVVSRASSVFDTVGIVSPLKNQIVRLLSTFVIMSKQNWNYVIPEDGFDLFLRMILETLTLLPDFQDFFMLFTLLQLNPHGIIKHKHFGTQNKSNFASCI